MENVEYAVGVDVGGSHVCSAVVNVVSGEMAGEPCTTPVDSSAGAAVILDALTENVREAISSAGLEHVENVGFAFPGPFDYVRGISIVEGVGKFDRIFGLDVAASLRSRLSGYGVKNYRFVNDASAFALGECLGGAARNAGKTLALTLGTGVGSGFVSGRRLVESGDDVPLNGWVYHLPFEDGIVDEAFSTRWVCKRYLELTGETVAGARDVAGRYGDCPASRQLFDEYGRRLASFVVPVACRFGADVIVLGGNISRAFHLFGPSMQAAMAEAGYIVPVRTSALLDKAAMTGAASLFAV